MSVYKHFETLQVHAGRKADPATGACATPLYQTASFQFHNMDHAARLFSLEEEGFIYSRLSNPTVNVLEERISALEGCTAAVAVSSGQAAHFLTFQNLALPGDNFVAFPSLYGGTYTLFRDRFSDLGITFRFVPGKNPKEAESLIDDRTRGLFVETIANSDYHVPDFDHLAEICRKHRIPLIVDNTIATPYLIRPLEWGADIVVHSATKYLGGHGTSIGGVIVDAGRFDYGAHPDRFPQFTEPDPSYHGLVFAKDLGADGIFGVNLSYILKARLQGIRDIGASIAPFNTFLLGLGVETLSLRVQRHSDSALAIAQWLEGQDGVTNVAYSGLASSPWHELSRKYAPKGGGGVLAFTLEGGLEAGKAFVDALELHSLVANIGDVRSLVIHPASTTHSQLTEEEQLSTGVNPGLVRLSVGLEDLEDIRADLEKGFAAVRALSGDGAASESHQVA